MSNPVGYSDLRRDIARTAWSIWCPTRPLPAVPPEFYNIADYAIRSVHENVDKMISETIKGRLEKLLPPE
jgi:hypothetical protein